MTWTPAKAKPWHESLIDLILLHPDKNMKQLAVILDRTPQSIYYVYGSDLFQAQLAARRRDLNDNLSAGISEKMLRVGNQALDIMLDRLTTQRDTLPLSGVSEIADQTLSKLGYGGKYNGGQNLEQTNVNVVVAVDRSTLEEARSRLREVENRQLQAPIHTPGRQVVEGDYKEIGSSHVLRNNPPE